MKLEEIVTGLVVGRLTVRGFGRDKKGKLTVLCDCACGLKAEFRTVSLGTSTNSCGCLLRSDLAGKTIGDLYVIGLADVPNRRPGFIHWECRCKCGSFLNRTSKYLNSKVNIVKACQECTLQRRLSKDPGSATWKRFFRHYIKSAENRGLVFNLDFDQFKQICALKCDYCTADPIPRNAYSSASSQVNRAKQTIDSAWINANGLDRKNNDLGYTLGNVVPCCPDCNYAKQQLSESQFFNLVKRIYENKKLHLL